MKNGFLIVARLKSTRLKKKILLDVQGEPLIRWMIRRIKQAKDIDEVILCTSVDPQDDPLITISEEEGISHFRGDPDDVLLRLLGASDAFNLDYIVNVTADCPLLSFEYTDITIREFKRTNADLITSLDLPHGFFVYGMKPAALRKVCEIKEDKNTEVWGRYFTDTGLFRVDQLTIPEHVARKEYRLTVDYQEDFEVLEKIFDHFGKETYRTSSQDIVSFLDAHPEILEINEHCKELYHSRWSKQGEIRTNLK